VEISEKTVVVTGGAAGIGKALCERFAQEDAKHVIGIDRAKRALIDQLSTIAAQFSNGPSSFAPDIKKIKPVVRVATTHIFKGRCIVLRQRKRLLFPIASRNLGPIV